MDSFLFDFALEIGFLSLLGVAYYFFQKRKILSYEENKIPLLMNFLLQSCLSEKTESPQPELDSVIEALDDYLNLKTHTPPTLELSKFATSPTCPESLGQTIRETLKELTP